MMINKTTIIAEIGVNHNGSVKKALNLVKAAKKSGADIAKFQYFSAERLVSQKAKKAPYQLKNKNDKEKQFKLLKPLEISINSLLKIKSFCKKNNIGFMISVFDETGIKAINKLKTKIIKIPSGEINNYILLKLLGKSKKKIILSTGMSNFKEIKRAIDVLVKNGNSKKKITLLQCNSCYPSPIEDSNLNVINEYKKRFDVNVGYSDHTQGIESSLAAVALGAKIIEKHFTLNKNAKGPDHSSSLNPKEFSQLVQSIRKVEKCLGNKVKKISQSEKQNFKLVRKSIVANSLIQKGKKFNLKNITFKRPAGGLGPEKVKSVIGRIAKKNFEKDEIIKL